MKIAFIGNFEAQYSTENYHKRAFESLGHTILPIQENRTTVKEVWDKTVGCDMLYWTHTHGFKIGSNEDIFVLLETLRDNGTPTVGYHLDQQRPERVRYHFSEILCRECTGGLR